MTLLSLPHRLAEIVRGVRNTVASIVHAVLGVMAVAWTLTIFLLLLVPVLLLALFLHAGPFTRVLRLLLLLLLLVLLLLGQSA